MSSRRRTSPLELGAKDYSLYRVICNELDNLQQEIQIEGKLGTDLPALATAMEDRRLLVEWLRDLSFPPASLYNDCGINEAEEERLLWESSGP
jgi:hypothetical protein